MFTEDNYFIYLKNVRVFCFLSAGGVGVRNHLYSTIIPPPPRTRPRGLSSTYLVWRCCSSAGSPPTPRVSPPVTHRRGSDSSCSESMDPPRSCQRDKKNVIDLLLCSYCWIIFMGKNRFQKMGLSAAQKIYFKKLSRLRNNTQFRLLKKTFFIQC